MGDKWATKISEVLALTILHMYMLVMGENVLGFSIIINIIGTPYEFPLSLELGLSCATNLRLIIKSRSKLELARS
jgi:hypothetical protein